MRSARSNDPLAETVRDAADVEIEMMIGARAYPDYMDEPTQQVAWIGLIGIAIGSFVTLVASASIPWVRASIEPAR